MKITIAGVGYVGLSLAVLLAQHHEVTAITTTESKADKLNQLVSPIQDYEIEHTFDTGENVIDFITEKAGAIRYSCWMGMIHGNIYVVDDAGTITTENVNSAAAPVSSCCDISADYAGGSFCCDAPIQPTIYPDELYEDTGMDCCE